MGLVSHSIPALTGGVSQQPDTLRFRSQTKTLENAWPSLIEGLQKRPPTEHHGALFSAGEWGATDKPAFHWVDRSVDERYLVGVVKGESFGQRLKVWDLLDVSSGAAASKYVKATRSAYDYMDSADPEDYRFQTVADVTFVVNRTKQPVMGTRTLPAPNQQVLLYVRSSLSSGADEKVVCTFNNANTAEINDPSASSVTLCQNIYAALVGDDSAAAAVTFNKDNDKISLPTGTHGYVNNMAVRISLDSGSDWPKWRYQVPNYNNNGYQNGYSWEEDTFNSSHVVYIRDRSGGTTGGTCKLSWAPDGPAIDISDNGGTTHTQFVQIGTGSPPTGFENCIVQAMPAAAGSSDTTSGNVLLITHLDGEEFTFTVSDGAGGTLVDVYKNASPTFTELPDTAVHDFTLTIKNDPAVDIDDYYVRFVSEEGPGVLSAGYWEEVAKPGIAYQIDASTMPHLLVRKADGTFDFTEAGRHEAEIYAVSTGSNDHLIVRTPLDTAPGSPSSSASVHFYKDGDLVYIRGPVNGLEDDVEEYKTYYVEEISVAVGSQTIRLHTDDGLATRVQITAGTASTYGTVSGEPIQPLFVWDERTAGDEKTNPDLTFIDQPIQDVAFFKNRLTFLAGENIVLSETGQFFNFWRTTVTQLLDTAPIDIASSWSGIARLETASPFEDLLYVSANRVQFVLGAASGQAFSAKTADIRMATNLSVDNSERPVNMNQAMYVPFTRGDYAGIYEYLPDAQVGGRFDQHDITEHTPQFIPGTIRAMAALEREGVLAVLGTDPGASGFSSTDSVYVYKTYKQGNKQVQAAWAKYTFHDADIRALFFYQHELFIVMRRTTGWWVDKIGFKTGRTDTDSDYITYLDRRFSYTVDDDDYNPATGNTVIGSANPGTMYSMEDTDPMEAMTKDGERLTTVSVDGSTPSITLYGDQRGKELWVGQTYTMTMEFSHQYMKEEAKHGRSVIAQGRLQVRRGFLLHSNTSHYLVTVTPLNRDSYIYNFSGQILGGGRSSVGGVPLETGRFQFPINSKNDEVDIVVTNDSPLPSNLVGAEFESNFVIRSGRAR